MLIRPFTLSQAAILLLLMFLLGYLHIAVKHSPGEKHEHTRWMMQAIVWAALNIFITMILGVLTTDALNGISYTRDFWGLLFWHAMIQSIYVLPPTEPFLSRKEPQRVRQFTSVLLFIEVFYFAFRLWNYMQTGQQQIRGPIMVLPIHLMAIIACILTLRKLWVAEAGLQEDGSRLTFRDRLYRAFIAPKTLSGHLYRGLLVTVFILFFVFVILSIINIYINSPALWLPIFSDIMITVAILVTLFAYLSSPLAPTGLEIRVMGAGLTIFLCLISVLGWVITVTFLNQQAPNIRPTEVFGTQLQVQFFDAPERYRPIQQMLSDLLTPLLWFSILGSMLFCGIYTLYYRSSLKRVLGQIIGGFQQVQQGNLTYRLPSIAWNDEFSHIATSFNQMTTALEESKRELFDYQQHLELLVDKRTTQLQHEMELRKRLELRQGIQDERTRIAQEAHDGLLQTLMGIRIRLNRGKRLSRMEAATIESELQELTGEITHSVQDLRNLINELNEKILPDGLVNAIEEIVDRQQRTYAVTINTEFNYPIGLFALNQELHMMRIVQEALSNASRHGDATLIRVIICQDYLDEVGPYLKIRVWDNGRGFERNDRQSNGWGLKNMYRRTEQLAGILQIQSQPGVGTDVEVRIPLA